MKIEVKEMEAYITNLVKLANEQKDEKTHDKLILEVISCVCMVKALTGTTVEINEETGEVTFKK